MTNDATLLQAFRDGDEAAFATLAERYHHAVYAACQRQAPPGEVEDCVQAVFLVLARRATAAARAPALFAWLYQVAHFVCRNAQRANARRRHTLTTASQPSVIGHAPEAAVLERLDAALMRLEGRQRAAVLLHASGSPNDSIAQSLGVTTDHASKLVQRGLTALRQRLSRAGAPIGAAMLLAVITTKPASAAHAAPITIGTLGHATTAAAALAKVTALQMTMQVTTAWIIAAAFAAIISIGGFVVGDLFNLPVTPSSQALIVVEQTPDPVPVPIVKGAAPLVLKIRTDHIGMSKLDEYQSDIPIENIKKKAKPSGSNQFTLPLNPAYSYNFTIEWGDATTQVVTTTASPAPLTAADEYPEVVVGPTHTYAAAGIYTVKITANVVDGFPALFFSGVGDKLKLLEIAQWGDVTWGTMHRAFYDCENLTITATDAATAQTGGVSDFSDAWLKCRSLTSFPLINTAAGTNFYSAWAGCSGLTSFPLINTAAGTNFEYAWYGCSGLANFPLINTAAGTNFGFAWSSCSGLTSFPLINTAAGTNFHYAWYGCSGLTSFPLINTAAGTDFAWAWFDCSGLTSFPLVNAAAGRRFSGAWHSCSGLTIFPLINTAAGTDFGEAWSGCRSLTSFPLINTAAGTNFRGAWSSCRRLTSFPLINTAAGADFARAWYDCSGLTSFPLINTAAGTNFDTAWSSCSGLTSFPLINTAAGTNFELAWSDCRRLTSFPLINTAAGTNFKGAWSGCRRLTSFPLINTAAGTNFAQTWFGCRGLTDFPPLNLGNMTDGTECFSRVTLATSSYSDLLSALAVQNSNADVTFDGGLSKCNAAAASVRAALTGTRKWKITDADNPTRLPNQPNQPEPPSPPPAVNANDF